MNNGTPLLNEASSLSLQEEGAIKTGGLRTMGCFKRNLPNAPLVTVITIVFNGERYLEATIQSVINQTYSNFEYIVIDGGSTDGTLNIIRKYESRIDYWISQSDNGIYDAMNQGIALAGGEWLNMMNGGDEFFDANVLQKAIPYLNSAYDFIYSDAAIKENEVLVDTRICSAEKNIYLHQSIIYRRRLHKELGSYVVGSGVTISDFIFMLQVDDSKKIKIDNTIAKYATGGISNSPSAFYQRMAVELIFAKRTPREVALIIMVYPFYRFFQPVRVFFRRIFWAYRQNKEKCDRQSAIGFLKMLLIIVKNMIK